MVIAADSTNNERSWRVKAVDIGLLAEMQLGMENQAQIFINNSGIEG